MEKSFFARDKTIADFGDQWTRHTENEGRYASLEQFADIIAPFLSTSDFQDKKCVDVGSGTGRIVRMLIEAGAKHVTAIEPSRAFEVLEKNTADLRNKITCLNVRGDQVPQGDFDIVVSIGVIHHIPDPSVVLSAAFSSLKPGGSLLIWVYGHEGNAVYRSVFGVVRKITRRLPIVVNEVIAWVLYPPTMAYAQIAKKASWLPMRRYMCDVFLRFDPTVRRLVIVDQINPQWAKYYRRNEIVSEVERAGFVNVQAHHRHGYSWTVIGYKAESPLTRP